MNEPIGQHYIPRNYLKYFTEQDKNSNEKIYVRRKGTEKPFETSTKKICFQNDLYTIPNVGIDKKYSVEKFYGDTADKYFSEIHDLLVDENVLTIDFETRRKIISAALSLYFRTPKFLNIKNKMVEDIIQEIASSSKNEDISISYFGDTLHFKRNEAKQIIKEEKEKNRILFLAQHLEAYKIFIEAKIMNVIYVDKVVDDSELITCDNPVIIRPFVNPTLPDYDENEYFSRPINPFDPSNMIHLTIDKKHILTIMPDTEETVFNKIHRKKISFPDVLLYNNDMEKFSDLWVIGTRKGLLSHIDDQDEYKEENEKSIDLYEFMKSRTLLMLKFTETLEVYGINSIEFRNQVNELFDNEVVKSDPGFFELVKSLKGLTH